MPSFGIAGVPGGILRATLRDALDFVERLQTFNDVNSAWAGFLEYALRRGGRMLRLG